MRQTVGKTLAVVMAVAVGVLAMVPVNVANAAQLTNRKLTLVAGASDGGSKPGGVVNHLFTFNIPTAGTLGSIKFEYCTTASVNACVAPTGMSASAATFGSESGSGVTGFSMGAKTANSFILTRTAAANTANALANLQANSITNPTTVNSTFFVRITTYTAASGGGTAVDNGSVAASTAEAIVLSGVMPESLIFCTGATVNTNCTTTTAGTIAFNQLFSPSDTATATSQMSASTNAGGGYAISVNGPTLTSGSNTIPGLTTAATAASTRGTSRWGLNLKANTTASSTVAAGTELTPVSNGTDLKGQAATGYNTADTFKFTTGDIVANSSYDGTSNNTPGATNSQVYTATYIANAAGNQASGTYTTTLTYICTPTF